MADAGRDVQRYFDGVQLRIQAARDRGDLPVAPVGGLPVKTGPSPTPVPPEKPAEAMPSEYERWAMIRENQKAIRGLQQQKEAEVPHVAVMLGHLALKSLLAASIGVGIVVGLAGAMLTLLARAN